MRSKWILYPEAERKLKESGLAKMIETAKPQMRLRGEAYKDSLPVWMGMMQRGGAFRHMAPEDADDFKSRLGNAFAAKKPPKWSILRNGMAQRESMELDDIMALSGYVQYECCLLSNNDLFNYRKFGFSNLFEFTGTVGAALENAAMENTLRPVQGGLWWGNARQDGRTLLSCVSGNSHYDLCVRQIDVTAYPTRDPLGNAVSYRPATNYDCITVLSHQHAEPDLLVAILQYVGQMKLRPKSLEQATDTQKWVRSLGQRSCTSAERTIGRARREPGFLFDMTSGMEMPKTDRNYALREYSSYCLPAKQSGGFTYEIHIGAKDEMVIPLRQVGEQANADPMKTVSFAQNDMDSLIRSLLFQCASGIGRTPARDLIHLLEYRLLRGNNRQGSDAGC